MPFATSSFLLLVAMPGAPSSILVTTSKALVTRSDALVSTSFLFLSMCICASSFAKLQTSAEL